jgi:superfamily II DNA or RNA helicase
LPAFFQDHHSDLKLSYAGPHRRGLRRAQVAAIWALAARAIEGKDPAQAILPTGTGKTAVITALPFALKAQRVLVITPSQVVRRQIAREFASFTVLRRTGALPRLNDRPVVLSLERQIRRADAWEAMRRHEVVVSTPQCVSPAYKRVVPAPSGLFDLLIVDEAHHEPAKTWRALIEHFSTIPRLMLTATPFRRDRRGLSGEIAYWYSLHDAIADGVYSPIHFRAVRPHAAESADDAVARTAITRLDSEMHRTAGSQLVVRTDRIEEALKLQQLYATKGLDLAVLSSNSSASEVGQILTALENGDARGVVVIGVLTEGFDLPNLKIAAYHRKHQSLAATLQFIGRISRATPENVQPELIAVPEEISSETRLLYDEDASWTELLPRIADTAVARERERRRYSEEFDEPRGKYSRSSIYPDKRVQCYQLNVDADQRENLRLTADWPDELVRSPVYDYTTDSSGELALIITRDLVHPTWLLSDALDSFEYSLHLACLDREHGYLYLSSETDASRRALLQHFNLESATEVPPDRINAVLYSRGVEHYSSVGVRMSREIAQQGVSYQILTGRDAARGVGPNDATGASAGHLIGRYQEGTAWHSVSVSLETGRLRESGEAALLDFKDWCFGVSTLLDQIPNSNTPPGLTLPIRSSFASYPPNAIGVTLPDVFYSGDLELDARGTWINSLSTDARVRSAGQQVLLGFASGDRLIAVVAFDTSGRVHVTDDDDIDVRIGGEIRKLSDVLTATVHPQFFFADGTTVVGNGLLPARGYHAGLRSDIFEVWDWTGVDPRRESRPPRPEYGMNIQSRAIQEFATRHPDSFIVVDDGAGEIADVIVLWFPNERMLQFSLIHCKWSSADNAGHRLEDLYQVVCQTMRSLRWGAPVALLSELANRLAQRRQTRMVQGSRDQLLDAINRYRGRGGFAGRIYAVQPGVSETGIDTWIEGRNLIASCDEVANRLALPLIFCISE